MAKLNVGGEIKAPIITATETINCDTTNVWFGGAKAIDSGSNANGYWVRYADGTQMCYCMFYKQSNQKYHTVTLPAPFIDTEYGVFKNFQDSTSTTQLPVRIFVSNERTTSTFETYDIANRACMIAVGRWK